MMHTTIRTPIRLPIKGIEFPQDEVVNGAAGGAKWPGVPMPSNILTLDGELLLLEGVQITYTLGEQAWLRI